MSAPRDEALQGAKRERAAMRFAFEVSGTVVERSPVNGGGPRPLVKSYRVVGCSAASAEQTASQLYHADAAETGLRPVGAVTIRAAAPAA